MATWVCALPPVFQDYTAAVTEGDSAKVCDELLSATGAEALEAESGEPCQLAVTHSTSPGTAGSEFELRELRPAGEDRVDALFSVDGTSEGRLTFVAMDGEWRVEYEADPAVLEAQEEFERQQQELQEKIYGGQ